MRSPIDELNASDAQPSSPVASKPREPKPPGGKALRRLALFDEQRGLPFAAGTAAAVGAPKKSARRKASESGQEGGPLTDSIAETYAAVATALQAGNGRAEMAAGDAAPAPAPGPNALAAPSWRALGPTVMPNGQTYGASRVDVSGRIAAIAIDPSNRDHVLAGSAAGGIWESRDRGATWVPRTDTMATLTVGAIAFAPNPQTVFAGTGEGNAFARLGAGVLRSTNGGATWALLGGNNPFVGQGFFDLVVDPANANHLLAATTRGIHESTDGGVNWTARRTARCWDLSMNPAGGAAAEVLAACSDGHFRSTNGGQTWTAVALPGAPASFQRLAVALAPSGAAVAYVFGSGAPQIPNPDQAGATMPTPYLWRRTIGGGAFTALPRPADLRTGQSWYDWFLAVAPDSANRIYLGAISAWRGEVAGANVTWQLERGVL